MKARMILDGVTLQVVNGVNEAHLIQLTNLYTPFYILSAKDGMLLQSIVAIKQVHKEGGEIHCELELYRGGLNLSNL